MTAVRKPARDPSARGHDLGGGRSLGGWGVPFVLAAILSLLVIAIAAPRASAQQQTWACDAYGYLFQGRDSVPGSGAVDVNEIFQVDLARGGTPTKLVDLEHPVNGVGFNIVDGFFYGMQNNQDGPDNATSTWSLVRVHPDGSVDDLGQPTGPGGTMGGPLAQDTGFATGEIDRNGHYWVVGSVTQRWYEIDLTTPTPTLLRQGPISAPAGIATSPDWTYSNGALYSHGIRLSDRQAFLLRFDLSNPDAGFMSAGAIAVPSSPTEGASGAAFADASGYVYFSQNATGKIFRVDPVTRQTIEVAQGPSTSGNDGARCTNAVVPTITVTKSVNGRVRPADEFTVGLVEDTGRNLTSATTSGGGTTASTINWPVSQGHTYTITDAMAAGSPTPLGEYAKSIRCTDADGDPVATGGNGPTWTLNVAEPTFYTCNVTNTASADVVLEKSVSPTPVVPGEDVTFELKLTNNGPSTAIGETITDKLPAQVTFGSASAGCSEAGGTVTCAAGDLAPGESKTFTIRARVASSLDHCLRNSATASGATFDPDTSNNTDEVCGPIKGRADLRISKTPSRTQVLPGGQVMYTLVVKNDGPSDATGVRVVDPLAQGLTLVSANPSQGSCSTANNQLTCDMGKLAADGSAQVVVTTTVWSTLGDITNTACVSGDQQDPTPGNNCDPATVTVVPGPDPVFDLDVRKSSSAKRATVGQKVRYKVVVINNGPEAAPNVTVKDTLNRPVRVVSVRASAGECSQRIPMTCELGTIESGARVTITIVAEHREAGCRQRNAASATGAGNDRNPDNNLDTVNVCVRKVPLQVRKVASSGSVRAGGLINYRIQVRNPSRGVARRVRVCDRLPSGLAFASSKPKAKLSRGRRCWTIKQLGARQTRTFLVTVRALPGASGRKVNTATANSRDARAAARAKRPVRVLARQGAGGGVTG